MAGKHYLLVTAADFEAGAAASAEQNSTSEVAQNPAQSGRHVPQKRFATAGNDLKEIPRNSGNKEENGVFPRVSGDSEMEVNGLEPMTLCLQSRCSPN